MENETNNFLGDDFDAAMRLGLQQAYQTTQYEEYIYAKLLSIPILNLWDVCSLAAIDMLHQSTIPACINGLDWEALNNENDDDLGPNENTIILLEPVQLWLSEQIIKSINGEIKPQVIGRFFDGMIDSKLTYIDIEQIDRWLLCRGLYSKDEKEYTQDIISDSLLRLVNIIKNESSFLRAKVHKPDFEYPGDSKGIDDYFMENARLNLELQKVINRRPHYQVKSNAHEERHAKKREQVLGAAFAVLARWPNECRDGKGDPVATKIAASIGAKAHLFWPDTTPPLEIDTIEILIREWIKKVYIRK